MSRSHATPVFCILSHYMSGLCGDRAQLTQLACLVPDERVPAKPSQARVQNWLAKQKRDPAVPSTWLFTRSGADVIFTNSSFVTGNHSNRSKHLLLQVHIFVLKLVHFDNKENGEWRSFITWRIFQWMLAGNVGCKLSRNRSLLYCWRVGGYTSPLQPASKFSLYRAAWCDHPTGYQAGRVLAVEWKTFNNKEWKLCYHCDLLSGAGAVRGGSEKLWMLAGNLFCKLR